MTWTYQHEWTITAPPARVFRALTDGRELTWWFAEHAESASRAGEPFRFWGRHTLGLPSRGEASQVITRLESDRALGFTWRIGAADTDVAIDLEPKAESTLLRLTHRITGDVASRRPKELIDDHWRLAVGNLMSFLGNGDGLVLPDYGDPAPVIRFSLFIDAPPESVFRTITEPALINQWFFTDAAEVEPRIGGRYATNWRYQVDGRDVVGGPTKILDLVNGRRLVVDWTDWRGDNSVTGQTISFDLAPEGTGTRLTFVHAGFERPADMSDYPFGWSGFMGGLKSAAEAEGAQVRG